MTRRRPVSVVTLREPQERVLLAATPWHADEPMTRLDALRGLLSAHEAAQQAPPRPWWHAVAAWWRQEATS